MRQKAKRTAAEIHADSKRTGRPPAGRESRSIPLVLRVTATEKRIWTRRAKAEKMGLGPWLALPRRRELERGK